MSCAEGLCFMSSSARLILLDKIYLWRIFGIHPFPDYFKGPPSQIARPTMFCQSCISMWKPKMSHSSANLWAMSYELWVALWGHLKTASSPSVESLARSQTVSCLKGPSSSGVDTQHGTIDHGALGIGRWIIDNSTEYMESEPRFLIVYSRGSR